VGITDGLTEHLGWRWLKAGANFLIRKMNVKEPQKMSTFGHEAQAITSELISMTPEKICLNGDGIGISKTIFPTRACTGLAVAIGLLFAIVASAADVLTNPGFEMPGLAGWITFGPNNYSENTLGIAHGGTNFCKIYGSFIGAQNYTGIYQDNLSAPGAIYSADGWAFTLGSDGGGIHGQDAIWLEVSFRDASYNALALYRSGVVTSNNLARFGGTNTWFDLQITNQCSFTNASAPMLLPGTITNSTVSLVAPAGTAYVRYQVVFAQGPDNANGSMYFDDFTLNQTGGAPPPATQWNIIWSDEFNGDSINTDIWTFETGNGCPNLCGWGNNELEYYTSRTNNAYESGGLLHIVVRRETTNGFFYTSARMKTEGLYSAPAYGRFEWRAKLPFGIGMWPGLWMLGTNISSVGWPNCGEIDVVESAGNTNNFVQGSLHSNSGDQTAIYTFPTGQYTTNFHTYLLDWEPNSIQWYVDGQRYEMQTSGAPFNAPFFFLMNVAVGGNYVSNPSTNSINAGTSFPQEMQVDYIRILEPTAPLQIAATRSNGNVVLTWPTNIVCHLQVQTNSLTSGNWSDLPNKTNPVIIRSGQNNTCVFYRLESP
jgi:beta-glucanase (GH16 family)